MELAGQEEWVVNALNDFNQVIFGIDTGGTDAPGLVAIAVGVVALAAVAVAFDDVGRAIDFGGQAALLQLAVIVTKAHGAAGHVFANLVGHGGDQRLRVGGIG